MVCQETQVQTLTFLFIHYFCSGSAPLNNQRLILCSYTFIGLKGLIGTTGERGTPGFEGIAGKKGGSGDPGIPGDPGKRPLFKTL